MIEPNIEKIREIREHFGLTPPKLAKKAGVSKATINRIEAGMGTRVDTLKKIADALDVDLHALIRGGLQKEEGLADKLCEVDQGEMAQRFPLPVANGEIEGLKVSALLTRAVEILESSSVYRQALAANINAFHQSLQTETKNQALQVKIDSLESRLATLEEKINK